MSIAPGLTEKGYGEKKKIRGKIGYHKFQG